MRIKRKPCRTLWARVGEMGRAGFPGGREGGMR
jgi:hypothetical protein